MTENYSDDTQAIDAVLKWFPGLDNLMAFSYAEAFSFLERVMTTEDYSVLEEYPHIHECLLQGSLKSHRKMGPPARASESAF